MRSYRRSTRTARRVAAPTYRRSNIRSQAFGNMASAMQQRDSTQVVISTQEDVKLTVPVGCSEATLSRNCNAILTGCPYFENYMGMYDQYKINAVRVSAEMTYITPTLLNSATFPSICTSWDRNGIQIESVKTGVDTAHENAPIYKYRLPPYACVASYSSANEKTLYYGSRWGVVRQLDAASLMEKSIYLSTSNTRDVLSNGNLYGAWNPMLLISLKSPVGMSGNDEGYCKISLHWQYEVTLRGLRKMQTNDGTARDGATMGGMIKFKPNADFVGYARDNKGFAVLKDNTLGTQDTDWAVVGSTAEQNPGETRTGEPTINPAYNMPAGNGLVIPNTGLPGENIGL